MIDFNVLKENPELARNITIEASAADLLAFGESIHQRAMDAAIKEERYLTPKEFADKVQVSLVTLWSWDKKGITKPLRIGNSKRYRLSDVENFLSEEVRG